MQVTCICVTEKMGDFNSKQTHWAYNVYNFSISVDERIK